MGCIIEKLYLLLYQTVFSIGGGVGKNARGGVYIRNAVCKIKMIKIWQNVMRVIDSILTSCYYDVSIIPYWTYEVLTVIRVAVRRGNQVRILSDPVTVFGEQCFNNPLYFDTRRRSKAMNHESGNLLNSSKVKLPCKVWILILWVTVDDSTFMIEGGFFYGMPKGKNLNL